MMEYKPVKILKKSACLFCLLNIFFNSLQALSKPYLFKFPDYQPTINLSLKGGNQRTIGRIGGIIPLYGMNDNLWFTQVWGLWDSEAAKEWNVGLGYRRLLDKTIVGSYGFFDRRLSAFNQYHSQITLGAELLGHHLEGRINGYIPTTSAKVVGRQVDKAHRVSLVWTDLLEHPLGGIDIDIGGHLPSYRALEGFITYYHFNSRGVKAIDGIRIRGQFHVNHYVALTGEMSHDRLRKRSWFAGMQLEFRVGGMKQAKGLSKKMTQMVIRDIDVITSCGRVNKSVLTVSKFINLSTIQDKIGSIIVFSTNNIRLKTRSLNQAKSVESRLIPMTNYDIHGIHKIFNKKLSHLIRFVDYNYWQIQLISKNYGIQVKNKSKGETIDELSTLDHYTITQADSLNHLHGILPVNAIKVMLWHAKKHWDMKKLAQIPTNLIPNAADISLKDDGYTSHTGWLDALDILSRLIVLSIEDINKGQSIHGSSDDLQETVKQMLFMRKIDNESHILGAGRGMNSAGLLLSGCLSIRCLLDIAGPITKRHESPSNLIALFLAKITSNNIPKEGKHNFFSYLFRQVCLLDSDKTISEDNWLFSRFHKNDFFDETLLKRAMKIAESSITSAFSSSLWIPFDDAYALRGLLRGREADNINWTLLSFKWLLWNEAVENSYFSEISIRLGKLQNIYELIKKHAERFGFKAVQHGGQGDKDYLPLVLTQDPAKKNNWQNIIHKNSLYIRFLTGDVNVNVVRADSDVQQTIGKTLVNMTLDSEWGCWAGVDMFGPENFVYDTGKFHRWLDAVYEKLREIQIERGERNLWLRPHIGKGTWAEENNNRMSSFITHPRILRQKLYPLLEMVKTYSLNRLDNNVGYDIVKFIYRSLFTGWLPIDEIKDFNQENLTSISNLKIEQSGSEVSKAHIVSEISSSNLRSMIAWVDGKRSDRVEDYDKDYPFIRFGHGAYLGHKEDWSSITELHRNDFARVWVDLNLGSDVVTGAQATHKNLCISSDYIQTRLENDSKAVIRFVENLNSYNIPFVLGTDGQGVESTTIKNELDNFNRLVERYYEDKDKAKLINKKLNEHIKNYERYSIGNIKKVKNIIDGDSFELKANNNFDEEKFKIYDKIKHCTPHIAHLLEAIEGNISKSKVLCFYGNNAKFFGDYNLAKVYYTQALALQTEHYGPTHIQLVATLRSLGAVESSLDQYESAKSYYDRALMLQTEHYGEGHIQLADTLVNLGTVESDLGNYERAKGYYNRALTLQTEHYGEDHIQLAATLVNLGTVESDLGNYERAKGYYNRALTLQTEHYGEDHIQLANTLHNLGTVEKSLGQYDSAKRYYEQALTLKTQHYGQHHIQLAETLNSLGTVLLRLGEYEVTKDYLTRALALLTKCYGPNHIQLAATLNNLGALESDLGQYDSAKRYYEQALTLKTQHYGQHHIQLAAMLGNIGNVESELGQYETAKGYYEQALVLKIEHYGKHHIQLANILNNLGNVQLKLGRYKSAKDYYKQALALEIEYYGQNHIQVGTTLGNLGIIEKHLGQYELAKDYYEQALVLKTEHYGQHHIQLANTLNSLGNIESDLGQYELAKNYLTRALELQTKHYGPNHIQLAATLGNLGSVESDLGQYESAKGYYQQALSLKVEYYGSNHIQLANILGNLGNVESHLGQYESAKDYYDKALILETKHYGQHHIELANTLNSLGNIELRIGHYERAKDYYDRALALKIEHYGPNHIQLATTLGNLGSMENDLGRHESAKNYFTQALSLLTEHYGPNHIQLADILHNLGNVESNLGQDKTAKRYYEKALTLQIEHHGQHHIQLADTLYNLANVELRLGQHELAKNHFTQVLGLQTKHYSSNHIQLVATLVNLGIIESDLGNYEKAKGYYDKALTLQTEHYGEDHIQLANILHNLGTVELRLGEYKRSKGYYDKALALKNEHYGPNHIQLASTLNNLGLIEKNLGQYERAKGYYDKALALKTEHYGKDHIQLANTLNNLGLVESDLGQYEQAKGYYDKALALKIEHYGPNHIRLADTLHNLGSVERSLGQYELAKNYLTQALALQTKHYGEDHIQLANTLNNLGLVESDLGEYKRAKGYYDKALALKTEHYSENHIQLASTLNNLGLVESELGEYRQAKRYYDKALSIQTEHYGEDHIQLAATLVNLGIIERNLGEYDLARDYYDRALSLQTEHYGESHIQLTSALIGLGTIEGNLGQYEQAKRYYDKALSLQTEHYGENHIQLALILINLGTIESNLGEDELAKSRYEQALVLYKEFYGEEHYKTKKIIKLLNDLNISSKHNFD